eukprot:m51a1_g14441 hypothetical protein (288) ;mRNA; f:563727-564943
MAEPPGTPDAEPEPSDIVSDIGRMDALEGHLAGLRELLGANDNRAPCPWVAKAAGMIVDAAEVVWRMGPADSDDLAGVAALLCRALRRVAASASASAQGPSAIPAAQTSSGASAAPRSPPGQAKRAPGARSVHWGDGTAEGDARGRTWSSRGPRTQAFERLYGDAVERLRQDPFYEARRALHDGVLAGGSEGDAVARFQRLLEREQRHVMAARRRSAELAALHECRLSAGAAGRSLPPPPRPRAFAEGTARGQDISLGPAERLAVVRKEGSQWSFAGARGSASASFS